MVNMDDKKKYTGQTLFIACFLTACLTASSVSITNSYFNRGQNEDLVGKLDNIENILNLTLFQDNLTIVQDFAKGNVFNYTTTLNPDFGVVTIGNVTFLDGYYTNVSISELEWDVNISTTEE